MNITQEQYPIMPAENASENLPFEKALSYLRSGLKIYRKGWSNTNLQYIKIEDHDIRVQKENLIGLDHFDFENEDILKEDWCIYKK